MNSMKLFFFLFFFLLLLKSPLDLVHKMNALRKVFKNICTPSSNLYEGNSGLFRFVIFSVDTYETGVRGVDACPTGLYPITDELLCRHAEAALGYPYVSSSHEGNPDAVCNVCFGCSSEGSLRFSHGSSKTIIKNKYTQNDFEYTDV